MKYFSLIIFLFFLQNNLFCQISFKIEENIISFDLSVKVSESTISPDITVKIGYSVYSPDFTAGISSSKSNADFIITKSNNADIIIKAGESIISPDISIRAGENVSSQDVTIKILKTGNVDYFVYTENDFISLSDLIIALLPAINKKLDYKLKNIPFYKGRGNDYSENSNFGIAISELNGSSVIAQDEKNTFLGKIANEYDSESIFNEYSTYGNSNGSECIWNEFSRLGNGTNSFSPFNDYSSKPPLIVKDGKIIGYLTTNKSINRGISPYFLQGIKDKF